jgi:hypothetical protein
MRIFALRYQKVDQLADIISALIPSDEATILVDRVSHKFIVATLPDRLEKIGRVIEQLDVPPADRLDVPQMLYRIYMLELPPEHGDLKPFSIVLERSSQLSPADLLDAVEYADIELGVFSQETAAPGGQMWELVLEGRAASNDAVKRMLERIPKSQMKQLQWDDEIFTPPAAQVAQLPDPLKEHIHRLLGRGVQTVGYWFGNLSVPGTVKAPIGPWVFDMQVDRSTQENEVELEIAVLRELPSGEPWQVLGNSVRGHIERPVIIGYNRESYGTRTMGAMVIVPQESPLR